MPAHQLNINLNRNPQLLEAIRKLCKARGMKISTLVIQILEEGVDREIAGLSNGGGDVAHLGKALDSLADEVRVLGHEVRSRLDALEQVKQPEFKIKVLKEY
jgi:acetolactate synthase regulatory subunit